MAGILLIEDDLTFAHVLEGFLTKQNHQVYLKTSIREALPLVSAENTDLILLDYRLPDGNGLDLMEQIRQKGIRTPVIMMTSFHDVRTAVKAIRNGAFDYITKPVNPDELSMILQEALYKKSETAEQASGQHNSVEGNSKVSRQLYEHIQLVAPTNMSVLILGESGTGKEHAARRIHQQSTRSHKPFIAIDCGALSSELAASELFGHVKGAFTGAIQDKKGQFELANGGTLFLDEVGNLSYEVQVKMLRVLQEKVIQPMGSSKQVKADVRIIAATNDDLLKSVSNGQFREDLYHRLNEFKIKVPPLRERGEDIQAFVDFFRESSNAELNRHVSQFSPQVMELFKHYDWPGNLRELKNVVKRAVLLSTGEVAGIETLPEEMTEVPVKSLADTSDLKAIQEQNEKDMILKVLQQTRYNKAKTARLLNIDRKTLYLKMAKYQIDQE